MDKQLENPSEGKSKSVVNSGKVPLAISSMNKIRRDMQKIEIATTPRKEKFYN